MNRREQLRHENGIDAAIGKVVRASSMLEHELHDLYDEVSENVPDLKHPAQDASTSTVINAIEQVAALRRDLDPQARDRLGYIAGEVRRLTALRHAVVHGLWVINSSTPTDRITFRYSRRDKELELLDWNEEQILDLADDLQRLCDKAWAIMIEIGREEPNGSPDYWNFEPDPISRRRRST